MIEVTNLTKRYGDKAAVSDLTFTVQAGSVTGFLGPNGAGKSTTMRMIVGLDTPSSGTALVDGKPYVQSKSPLRTVGALLEAKAVHKSRSAYHHLLAMAQTHGIPKARVEEVIAAVGLTEVAKKRAGGFSLGMGQRLGIAAALLGDPATIILDEPVNGLDPDGVLWVRNLLRAKAAEGAAVFVSSHLMSEMAMTAERLVIIGRGRLIADTTVADLINQASIGQIHLRTPAADQLGELLATRGGTVTSVAADQLDVTGISSEAIGDLAAAHGIPLYESTPRSASLEEAYMALTSSSVEYRDTTAAHLSKSPTLSKEVAA